MLDFVEGLMSPGQPEPKPKPATAKAGPAAQAPKPPTAKAEKPAAKKDAAKIAPAPAPAAAPAVPAAKPRKRAKPAPDVVSKRTWTRGLKSRLAIAASIGVALFLFKDDIPRLLVPPVRARSRPVL